MKIFFTADCHFDHGNIIKYANRPFKNVNHMNEELIRRWNERVSPEDTVYHLGDFAFKNKGPEFEQRLNGHIVHIKGNHDKNNGTNAIITNAVMHYAGLSIYAVHKPPESEQTTTVESNLVGLCDIILCAHVHDLWKWKLIKGKYAINVGMDVWNYEPIQIHSILKLIANIKKGKVE